MPEHEPPFTYSDVYRQIVVTLRKGDSFIGQRARLFGALERQGVHYEQIGQIEQLWMVAIQLAENEDVEAVIQFLKSSDNKPIVDDAEQNRPMRSTTVNDPLWWEQWAPRKMVAEPAWEHAASAPTVVVAILDTGIKPTHPDLDWHLWDDGSGHHGYNILTNTRNVADEDGHGTLLAGTIGAISNNTVGIAAAEWPIRLMVVKFHDVRTPPTAWTGALAIVWAVGNKAQVINASWDVGLPIRFLKTAIRFANFEGVPFVAAAGNDGLDNDDLPTYPASYDVDNVVSVMATDEDDDKPGFSELWPEHRPPRGARRPDSQHVPLSHRDAEVAPVQRDVGGMRARRQRRRPLAGLESDVDAGGAARAPDRVRGPGPLAGLRLEGPSQSRPGHPGPAEGDRAAGRRRVAGGGRVRVTWDQLYKTPRCKTVSILLSENGGPYNKVLATGELNDGRCRVTAPSNSILRARLKIQSEQGPGLFHESEVFTVTGP